MIEFSSIYIVRSVRKSKFVKCEVASKLMQLNIILYIPDVNLIQIIKEKRSVTEGKNFKPKAIPNSNFVRLKLDQLVAAG